LEQQSVAPPGAKNDWIGTGWLEFGRVAFQGKVDEQEDYRGCQFRGCQFRGCQFRGCQREFDLMDKNIVYIRTEPITPSIPCKFVNGPNYRCTIELVDGSTIMRCGVTVQHALANAIACYKTMAKPKI
jgi:hypothetical protein